MKVRTFLVTALAVAVPTLAACSGGSSTPTPVVLRTVEPSTDPTPTPAATVITAADGAVQFIVNLSHNGSPQAGTATFTQLGDLIDLRVRTTPSAPVQVMVLRKGSCASPAGYLMDLDPLIGGVSTQELRGIGMEALTSGDVTLVIGRGSGNFNDIAACADMPVLSQ